MFSHKNFKGHDLSSYRRMNGKDIIMNRIISTSSNSRNNYYQSNAGHSSFYQQSNSKMDTPILNRKRSSQRIWNSSGFVERGKLTEILSCLRFSNKHFINTEESALSDLERLARREKIYCMTQLQSSQQRTRAMTLQTDITTSQTTPQLARRPNKL